MLAVGAAAASAAVLLAAAQGSAAVKLRGVWIASGPTGKIVLTLRGSGSVYRGTYAEARKVSKVLARLDNADGVVQVTLTFTATHRSSLCGLRGARLYCQTSSGMSTFVRG